MYYIAESDKSFEQATIDLDAAVKRNGFGVLHIHDLGKTLRGKGVPFTGECRVFEVCNPDQAARVLATDMRLNMALPCVHRCRQNQDRLDQAGTNACCPVAGSNADGGGEGGRGKNHPHGE